MTVRNKKDTIGFILLEFVYLIMGPVSSKLKPLNKELYIIMCLLLNTGW